jgi:broad specificity phosphatase PhoE
MTELLLIRHGETDWNRDRRWQGQSDIPLNGAGEAQARDLAKRLRGSRLDAIFTSDLQRARQTAEAVAAVTGAPVREDRRLREIGLGAWEGMLGDEIRARDTETYETFRARPTAARPPGGESVLEVQRRVLTVLRDVLHAFPEGRVAIVSHGLALAALKVALRRLPLDAVWNHELDNAAFEVYQVAPEAPVDPEGGAG